MYADDCQIHLSTAVKDASLALQCIWCER